MFIVNRTAGKSAVAGAPGQGEVREARDLAKLSFDVIINATPLGMNGNRQSPLDEKELNTNYVFDLVYSPAEPS